FDNSSDFPSRMYDEPVPDAPDEVVPVPAAPVPVVPVPVVPAPVVLEPEPIVALARTYSLREELELDVVPVVPVVAPAPDDDISPCCRPPVTVTVLPLWLVLVLLVCAESATAHASAKAAVAPITARVIAPPIYRFNACDAAMMAPAIHA